MITYRSKDSARRTQYLRLDKRVGLRRNSLAYSLFMVNHPFEFGDISHIKTPFKAFRRLNYLLEGRQNTTDISDHAFLKIIAALMQTPVINKTAGCNKKKLS